MLQARPHLYYTLMNRHINLRLDDIGFLRPRSTGYTVKLAGTDHNDQFNTKRFVNTLDYSLDLIKLREVYECVYRRMDFTFNKHGKEYCRRVINVTFKYSVKEFNRFFDDTYIKFGYLP